MKAFKIFRPLLLVVLLAVAAPVTSFAKPVEPIDHKEQVQRLHNRLGEIKAIDKTKLNKEERKALRGEVKQIKKEMKAISGGVYLSVGAILLIALLIILLA